MNLTTRTRISALGKARALFEPLANPAAWQTSYRWRQFQIIYSLIILFAIIMTIAVTLWRYWPPMLFGDDMGAAPWKTILLTVTSIGSLFSFAMIFTGSALGLSGQSYQLQLTLALRRALAARDERVAPLASPQEPTDEINSADVEFIVAIPQAIVLSPSNTFICYVYAFYMWMFAMMIGLPFLFSLNPSAIESDDLRFQEHVSGIMGALWIIVGLAFIGIGIYQQRRRARQRLGMRVQATEAGLTFRQPIGRDFARTIAWASIRSIAQYHYSDGASLPHITYIVDSQDATLLFDIRERMDAPLLALDATQRQQGRKLLQVIKARTGLSEYDLTDAIAIIAGPVYGSASALSLMERAYYTALAEDDAPLAATFWSLLHSEGAPQPRASRKHQNRDNEPLELAQALLPYYPTEFAPETPQPLHSQLQRERKLTERTLNITKVGGPVFLAFFVILIIASYAMQSYPVRWLGSLAQQTTAQRPLYAAALTQPLAGWPTQQPTKSDPTSIAFTNGGYELANAGTVPNWRTTAWLPLSVHGDFALSVTITPTSNDGWGTAFINFDRSRNGWFHSLVLDGEGFCDLFLYPSKDPGLVSGYADGGVSSHFNSANDASNTLLIIRHGPLYLVYLNGSLAIHFYTTRQILTSGGLGFTSDFAARFTNLRIYPVPPALARIPLS